MGGVGNRPALPRKARRASVSESQTALPSAEKRRAPTRASRGTVAVPAPGAAQGLPACAVPRSANERKEKKEKMDNKEDEKDEGKEEKEENEENEEREESVEPAGDADMDRRNKIRKKKNIDSRTNIDNTKKVKRSPRGVESLVAVDVELEEGEDTELAMAVRGTAAAFLAAMRSGSRRAGGGGGGGGEEDEERSFWAERESAQGKRRAPKRRAPEPPPALRGGPHRNIGVGREGVVAAPRGDEAAVGPAPPLPRGPPAVQVPGRVSAKARRSGGLFGGGEDDMWVD